jgi:hypothetical protein
MSQKSQQDNAWKEIVEDHFRDFLEFFFPRVHAAVDWGEKPVWLDKEFEILTRYEKGERKERNRKKRKKKSSGRLDKLVKVRLLDGRSQRILAHTEIEGGGVRDLADRVHWYNTIASRHYKKDVLSLVVLTDETQSYRACRTHWELLGQEHSFECPVANVHAWEGKDEELATSTNVFAHVVRAYLALKRVRRGASRYESRLALAPRLCVRDRARKGSGVRRPRVPPTRELYRARTERENLEGEEIVSLLRFFEWLMPLSMEGEIRLEEDIRRIEGETRMPFMATFERRAMAKGEAKGKVEGKAEGKAEGEVTGKAQGLLKAVELGLKERFGARGTRLLPKARKIQDLRRLQRLVVLLLKAEKIGEIKAFLGAR